jgi:hypothetical protein
LFLFHLLVFLTISISFLAHLVAMASFLPLERLRPIARVRTLLRHAARRRAGSLEAS